MRILSLLLLLAPSFAGSQKIAQQIPEFCARINPLYLKYCVSQAVHDVTQAYNFCLYMNFGNSRHCEERVSSIDWRFIQKQILEATGTIEGGTVVAPDFNPFEVRAAGDGPNPYAQNYFIPNNN